MMDRVAANPGRMLITPENGDPAFYATVEMADNPSVVGTPLNKDSLLKDATAALFGLGSDAVPDDMFQAIMDLPIIGSKTFSSSSAGGSLLEVDLGFKPKAVIFTSGVSADEVCFLTPNSSDNGVGSIKDTGFTVRHSFSTSPSTFTVVYLVFK